MNRKPSPRALHQFLTGATAGDAITDQALLLRSWLRELGFDSHLYAQHIHDSMAAEVRSLAAYRPARDGRLAIYHHSIGSDVANFLQQNQLELLLIHHNVTPPEFFERVNPAWVQLAQLGQAQLRALQPQTVLALADSAYNELELHAAGYEHTAVLPIALAEAQLDLPDNEPLAAELQGKRPLLLFVGRLAPNKRQEDLVKLLYYLRRIQPEAQLVLLGDRWDLKYDVWVEDLAADLGLETAVTLTGKVSQQDMVTYYRAADLYVSMSEHEGFGKPFIESMYLGLPILAYQSTSVPYTLADAGVQFRKKDYARLAELADILVTNQSLRQRIIARQRQRCQGFLEAQVRQVWEEKICQLTR
ncbi:MAG: glycosyltransferase family 4 protein [Ardenticatenaceae bacterium]|nr:glycosyltransferase family 4 protein [Ardenticatenaceae bacterium]